MKTLLRVLCLCLVLSLLVGCAQKAIPSDNGTTPVDQQAKGDTADISLAQTIEAMNRPVAQAVTQQLSGVSWAGLVNGNIALCCNGNVDAATGQTPYLLVTLDVETENTTCLELTLPSPAADRPGLQTLWAAQTDATQSDHVYRTLAGVVQTEQGLVAVLDDTLLHTSPEQEIAQVTERDLTLCSLDADGVLRPIARLQMPQEFPLDAAVENLFLGQDATLWLTVCDYAQQRTALLGFSLTNGSLQRSLPLPENATCSTGAVATFSDGRLIMVAQLYEGPQQGMRSRFLVAEGLDSPTPHWQKSTLSPPPLLDSLQDTPAFVPLLQGQENSLLVNTGEGLVRWDQVAENAEKLYDWSEFSVDALTLRAVFGLADGRCVICRYDRFSDPDASYQLCVLTPLDPSVLAGRTVLTMATTPYSWVNDDPARQLINAFNANSTEYYIQTIDWTSRYLGDEILNRHDLPDIIMISSVESSILDKGVFIDLYPLLDADPALSREDLIPSILQASEVNGKLPTIVPAYEIRGLIGASTDVGKSPGWTLEECYSLCKQNPTPFAEMGKTWLLRYIVQNSGDWFVDWAQGQARFNTPEYARLLAFCATQPDMPYLHYPVEDEKKLDVNEPLANGKPLLLDQAFSGWGSVDIARYIFGQDYTLVGYPTPSESTNGCSLQPMLQLAITYTCQDPQAAWQVVRTFLQPEFQDKIGIENGYAGFPLRQDSLLAGAAKAQTMENPSCGYNYFTEEDWWAAKSMLERPLSQQDTDKIIEMIHGTTTIWNTDVEFFSILEEEAQAFYNGVRPADETAKITQERMQLYLDERS